MSFKEYIYENYGTLNEKRKGVPGKDRGSFDFFDKKDYKKIDFYAEFDEDIEQWYVYDTEKGFNWSLGHNDEKSAEEEAEELRQTAKDLAKAA